MYARTADGADMKGKADVLIRTNESAMEQPTPENYRMFDKFSKTAQSIRSGARKRTKTSCLVVTVGGEHKHPTLK